MTRGASRTGANGAVVALEAHAAGVRLPAGEFTTVKDTLRQQLTAYVREHCDPEEPVRLNFYLGVEEEQISLALCAASELEVMVLQPVIDRLNDCASGLGWFVYDVITKAGRKYPIYDDAMLRSLCEMLWFDPDMSDTEYADHLLEMEGEHRNGRDDHEVIEQLSAGYRPSDFQEIYGEHQWMLGTRRFKNGELIEVHKRPRSLKLREVALLLKQDMPDDLRQVVVDALALRKQIVRKRQWVHRASHVPDGGEDGYYGTPFGASCIAVWNWSDFASELIAHYEENEMNGGESDTVHMHFKAWPEDDESVQDLVRAFKDVVAWHSAVGRLLKHFPRG